MDDGTIIEILPKIFSRETITEGKVKKLLVDMLKTLRNAPFKSLQSTNVNIDNSLRRIKYEMEITACEQRKS